MKVTMNFRVRDMRTSELAELYDSPERSFRDWLRKNREKIGKKEGGKWNTHQVLRIIELRGPITAVVTEEEEL